MPPIKSVDEIHILTDSQKSFIMYMVEYQSELLTKRGKEVIRRTVITHLYDDTDKEILNSIRTSYMIYLIAGAIGERTYSWYKQRYDL